MRHSNDNTDAIQRKELGYDAADRVSAYNTIRVVYEQVLRPSTHRGLTVRPGAKQLGQGEDLLVVEDVLQTQRL